MSLLLKIFVVDIYHIHGNSMYPTLQDKDCVVISKISYGLRFPRNIYEIPIVGMLASCVTSDEEIDEVLSKDEMFKRCFKNSVGKGDIVSLLDLHDKRYGLIKRCVALSGESINEISGMTNDAWNFYEVVPYKGQKIHISSLTEDQRLYLLRNKYFRLDASDSTFMALDDFIFVVGDNIEASTDSRTWGPVPMDLVIGKCMFTF